MPTATLRRQCIAALAIAAGFVAAGPAAARAPEIEARITRLIAHMTLAEKIGQLNLVSNNPEFRPDEVARGEAGGVMNFVTPRDVGRLDALVAGTRLKIPLLYGLDIVHGFRTLFPMPLGEAASFNPDLARRAAEVAGREAASVGVNWTFAPMSDLTRDVRWGRGIEGFGEDVLMGRAFTRARVEGLRAGGVAVTLKHFAGYGAGEGGRDYDTTDIPRNVLRDLYLPPFRAGIDAGAESVMSAFNAMNGVPSTANRWLLTDVLRGEWKFSGFVTSDWGAVQELIAHGIAKDGAEAARKALHAGVDMDMASGLYASHLADEVKAGRVPIREIDEAVRRVLRVKLRMGLFDKKPIDPTKGEGDLLTPDARALAREEAREAIVLLRNAGDILPIRPDVKRIAVIGALADSAVDQMGPHAANGRAENVTTLLAGIRERAARAGIEVAFAPGCDTRCTKTDGFDAAADEARQADLVIAVMGETQDLSGEAASRATLSLPGRQRDLLDRLIGTGKPVVLALTAGRPLVIGPWLDHVRAVMMTWFLGTEGGPAFADILFGDVAPSGRLPLTWPRDVGQVPIHYDRLPTGRPFQPDNRFTLHYADADWTPQFPFGFGLTYTRFSLSPPVLTRTALGPRDTLEARVTITNTGEREGATVAQLYVRKPVAAVSRPLRELKAFKKVTLKPGESREMVLRVPARDLGYHDENGFYVVEAGDYELGIGDDASVPLTTHFRLTSSLRLSPKGAMLRN